MGTPGVVKPASGVPLVLVTNGANVGAGVNVAAGVSDGAAIAVNVRAEENVETAYV